MKFTAFAVLLICGLAGAVDLPTYIKRCLPDANLNKCAVESGNDAIKTLLHGDKVLRIPVLSPLKLPFVQLESTASLQLNYTDLVITGLEEAKLTSTMFDLDKKKMEFSVHVPKVVLDGIYHVKGQVLILPIVGEGQGIVTITDGDYKFNFDYTLSKKAGEFHAKMTGRPKFTFKVGKAHFDLKNLFNGDEALSTQMHKFLNENWEDVLKDFQGVIGDTIASICKNVGDQLFERVPFYKILA